RSAIGSRVSLCSRCVQVEPARLRAFSLRVPRCVVPRSGISQGVGGTRMVAGRTGASYGGGCAMNERDSRTKTNEREQFMPNPEPNVYRRAFWIALIATITLAIVATVLWWRLSHTTADSRAGDSSAGRPMEAIAE